MYESRPPIMTGLLLLVFGGLFIILLWVLWMLPTVVKGRLRATENTEDVSAVSGRDYSVDTMDPVMKPGFGSDVARFSVSLDYYRWVGLYSAGTDDALATAPVNRVARWVNVYIHPVPLSGGIAVMDADGNTFSQKSLNDYEHRTRFKGAAEIFEISAAEFRPTPPDRFYVLYVTWANSVLGGPEIIRWYRLERQ